MIVHSFRGRLAFLSAVVLAVVLLVVGVILTVSIRQGMQASIDRELSLRVQRFEHPAGRPSPPPPEDPEGFGPAGPPPGFAGRFNPGGGPGPDGQPPMGRPMMGPEGEPPPDAPPEPRDGTRPDWFGDREAERAARFIRPHFVPAGGRFFGREERYQPWDATTVVAAAAGQRVYSFATQDSERLRVLSVPWRRGNEILGAIQVARPMHELEGLQRTQLHVLLALFPIAVLLAGAGALFLSSRALRPVRELTDAAALIGAEDLSGRLEVTGRDELARLSSTFNEMLARLEASFEQQRRFTADASHELRTPLARIKLTTSEALEGDQSPEEYRQALRIADRAVDVMSCLVEELLLLARADAGQLKATVEPVDLRAVVRQARSLVPVPNTLTIVEELPPMAAIVDGNSSHLCRAVVNLLQNAVRYTPPEGRVAIRVREVAGRVEVSVEDTGEGIAPEHLAHLGERFYRVEASRTRHRRGSGASGGCGLGLAITRSLVEAYGGTLTFVSRVGVGTTATLSFRHSQAELPSLPSVPAIELVG